MPARPTAKSETATRTSISVNPGSAPLAPQVSRALRAAPLFPIPHIVVPLHSVMPQREEVIAVRVMDPWGFILIRMAPRVDGRPVEIGAVPGRRGAARRRCKRPQPPLRRRKRAHVDLVHL